MGVGYLNGAFGPLHELRVSVLDRGFIFGDGVYEVVPVYGARLFRLEEHLARLENSLSAVAMGNPHPREEWSSLLAALVEHNGGGDQAVYVQVTRGAAPRNHAFPDDTPLTVFAMSKLLAERLEPPPVGAVTRPDNRWGRCDIKSTALLANVLLRQQAVEVGASEALLLRDGQLTEGAASNVFVVREDFVVTPPKGPAILPGITRDLVIELAQAADLPCIEGRVSEAALRDAAEIWMTSSTMEVTPVVELDGVPVGSGHPGPVWKKMNGLFQAYKQRIRAGEA